MADAEPLTLLTAPLPVSDYSDFEDQQQQPETETGQQQRALHLHRLRFVNHLPAAITSLSLCPSSFSLKTLCPWISSSIHLTCSQLAAIGRANGDIQLFTTRDRKFLWSIPASVLPGAPIENITWSHRSILTPDEADLFPANEPDERQAYLHKLRRHLPRLFSTSGSQVIEYDWIAARPTVKKRLQLPGGAICDMVLDPQHGRYLAACTESGQIHVIDITESDQMEHLRSIDCPGAGKLLSLAWREKAKGWVTGGADSTVRKWDLNGKQAGQFNVAKKKSHTLVWALLVLSNGQIVTGDSQGNVKVFNGKNDTQISSFKSHKSDVLCLAAAGGTHFYSASCDQRTCLYTNVPQQGWQLTTTRRLHAHDVRAQVLTEDHTMLISGGLDMSLICTPCAPFTAKPTPSTHSAAHQPSIPRSIDDKTFVNSNPIKLSYVPTSSPLSFASNHRTMLRRQQQVDIWQFDGKGTAWDLAAQLHVNAMGALTLSEMSPDGQWILVGDLWRSTLWQFKNGKLASCKGFNKALKGKLPAMQYISASAATFSADSNKLVFTTYPAAKTPSQVVWFDLTTLAVSKVQPLKTSRRQVPITNGSARTLAGPKRLLKNQDLGRKELDTTTDDGMDSSSSSDDESDNGDNTETTLQPVGTHVCINAIGTVAVADSTRSLHILHKDGSHGLPTPSHPIAGLSFLPHLPNILVLVCTNSLLQIFDVASRSYAPWAKHLNTEDLDFKEQVIGLAVEPLPAVQGSKEAQLSMMLWGAGFTASFRLPTARALADLTVESGQKRQQRDEKADGEENDDSEAEGKNIEDAPDPTTLSNLRTNFRFEHLIGVAYLNHGELAISERPYVDLLPDLPAAFYKPSYGKA